MIRSVSITALLCTAALAAAEPAAPARVRGLDRYLAPPRADAVPMCVQAPPVGLERSDAPIGVLLDDPALVAFCFDPTHPPTLEVQQALEASMRARLTDRFVRQGSWPGSDNAPITLTWSFVPDGVSIPSGTGEPVAPSSLFAQMDAKFAAVGGRDAWIAQFQSVFDRWAALSGVSYQRVTVGGNPWDDGAAWGNGAAANLRGDIRIGMKPIDGALNIVAFNQYPSDGDMVLDSAENFASTVNNFRFLRNTIAHEHGHGLGLAHVCPANRTKLMEPFIVSSFDGPQQDEIRGVHRSYGDIFEGNNSAAAATNLGTLAPGSPLTPSLVPAPAVDHAATTSISPGGDADFFRVTTAAPVLVTITAAPVGTFYADYTQSQDPSCNTAVPSIDALNQANLAVDLTNSTGTTNLATANSTGFGVPESLTYLLSPPGNHYFRVRAANSPVETQLYELTVSAITPVFTASDGGFADRVRLNWNAIPSTSTYTLFRGTTTTRSTATQIAALSFSALQHDDFPPVVGATYYYWLEATVSNLGGSRPAAGPESGFRASAPANNACASAAALALGSPALFNTALATTDGPTEGLCFSGSSGATDQVSADVWYIFTPPSSGPFTIRTCGSAFNTRLALYTGGCPTSPNTAAACSDDAPACGGDGLQSGLRAMLAAGQPVRIRVGGAPSAGGAGQVQVFCPADVNFSGSVTVQDIFDLLAAYFADQPSADYNSSGSNSVQDLFDFLAAYFSPCS